MIRRRLKGFSLEFRGFPEVSMRWRTVLSLAVEAIASRMHGNLGNSASFHTS